MASSTGRQWITYNGELYNYRALRDRGPSAGGAWRSSSDTEVVLDALATRGTIALEGLRGMFALAWWDTDTGTLVLARDRFGIKPLVWAQPERDLLLFASTPQALAASGYVPLRPSAAAQASFLSRGSVDGCYWDGIQTVAPGSALVCTRGGRPVETRYWQAPSTWNGSPRHTDAASAAAVVREAIVDSVRAHLVADVPVALFLSGGRDSSALAGAVPSSARASLRALTVTMPDSSLNEAAAARATAVHFGLPHTEVAVNDLDRDQILDAWFAALAQPSIDGLNTFIVARAAREAGVTVALSGVGGDELLGGYPSFVDVPRLFRWCRTLGVACAPLGRLASAWPSARATRLAEVAAAPHTTMADTWWAYRQIWPDALVQGWTGVAPAGPPSEAVAMTDPFQTVRHLEWTQFLQRQLLPDADAYTMSHALELRVPFVDHMVLEQVAAAGLWPRAGHASWKAALFAEWPDWVEPSLRHQQKRGFVLPMDTWLRQALHDRSPRVWRDVADRLLQPAYQPYVRAFLAGRLHWSRLWALYVWARVGR
jgi:asparagine synthase (glutamine-hydrolysing)